MRIFSFVVCMLASLATSAQESRPVPRESVAGSIGTPWTYLGGTFVALADAMPADRYDFAPTRGEFAGVRTFAEQVKHVACANYGFFSQIAGEAPPANCAEGGPSPPKTKAELTAYLRESFAFGSRVAATLDERNMLDVVDGPYGGSRAKLEMAVLAVWHASDHYGQLVEYLRMNGIIPPASRR